MNPVLKILGHLIELVVLRGVLNLKGDWAYRIPFAIQLVEHANL